MIEFLCMVPLVIIMIFFLSFIFAMTDKKIDLEVQTYAELRKRAGGCIWEGVERPPDTGDFKRITMTGNGRFDMRTVLSEDIFWFVYRDGNPIVQLTSYMETLSGSETGTGRNKYRKKNDRYVALRPIRRIPPHPYYYLMRE